MIGSLWLRAKKLVLVELLLWIMLDVLTTYNKVGPLTYVNGVGTPWTLVWLLWWELCSKEKVIKRHLVRHLFLQELDPCVAHNELFVEMEIGPSFSLWRSLREIVLFAKMQIIQICWRLLEVTAIARKETLLNNETVMSLTIAWVMVEEAWDSFFLSFFLSF